ncbi:helix-turn-helix domain-containing protein [Mycobacterium marinum]|uniref:helix-turn-helix domain-containing protein n=1 Tax=Mycobacterium marinum TaxID=1781 RepID=UPI002359C01E|nr:helix-turn-helix domain-containing protein [Mycobacterium marinum]MDC8980672.1 helix-turn-helix domain-containing protein [Mycobacterium marinum]MDC8997902.1 helix-turn-helix domain-containing protein [Mycobacterium marinum]MDC9008642.1 helix-turn-helix domain-containing protein [Mycobacterium marinum]
MSADPAFPLPYQHALTFGQVAARFGVDVLTVKRWVRTEQCPSIREGRRVRIPAAWVEAQSDVLPRAGR